ncbi:MAG: hypothetical protein ABEI13_03825, partial [Candidatus Paceibacteria bacterium]
MNEINKIMRDTEVKSNADSDRVIEQVRAFSEGKIYDPEKTMEIIRDASVSRKIKNEWKNKFKPISK